jgi:thiamine biosynthesis lipoprotein
VSAETLEVLQAAQRVSVWTSGKFDVTFGALAEIWKFDHDKDERVPTPAEIGARLPMVDYTAVAIDAAARTVFLSRPGMRIHLGGIGKGYAVDVMAELLEDWGLDRAFVHGGFSSALALDAPAGNGGWALTLSDPGEPSRVLARLSMRQAALSASGVRKGDHILDPRTRTPVRGRRAAWVALPRPARTSDGTAAAPSARIAPAAVADALTTAFMLLSVDDITALCEGSPGLEVWIIPGASTETADLLHFKGPQGDD